MARLPPSATRLSEALSVLALLGSAGCASRHDAGEALIGAGTLVAIASSEAATRHGVCVETGCAAQTSRHAAQAAAGVGAGVALAAVGAALESQDSGDVASRPVAPPPPAGSYRLVRKPEESEEPPAYYIEE